MRKVGNLIHLNVKATLPPGRQTDRAVRERDRRRAANLPVANLAEWEGKFMSYCLLLLWIKVICFQAFCSVHDSLRKFGVMCAVRLASRAGEAAAPACVTRPNDFTCRL